jgi:hypothetical protein
VEVVEGSVVVKILNEGSVDTGNTHLGLVTEVELTQSRTIFEIAYSVEG